jgi:hypothetical protein
VIALGAVLGGAATIVVLTAIGGSGQARARPPVRILRGSPDKVDARLRPIVKTIAARVERLRGLKFEQRPHVVVMDESRIAVVGQRIARRQRRQSQQHPSRLRTSQRLERSSIKFDQLAGLLPSETGLGPDTKASGLEQVGGAFDYPRDRIIIVPAVIQSRMQLDYTLAHELTHALEDQHFHLHLGTFGRPGEASSAHRAVIEGTATLIQSRYQHRYLGDDVRVAERIDGLRSLLATSSGAYAVNAQAIFDYVDGAQFIRSLYRRAGGWSLVDRVLRAPPRQSQEILHPHRWPADTSAEPVRLGIGDTLGGAWRRVGGGSAGEEQALVILLAAPLGGAAELGASGWDGGRFSVWRPRSQRDCGSDCIADDVGVVAFRWHHLGDASQFSLAVPGYATLGLLAQPFTKHVWKRSAGYLALGTASRGSALAFGPDPRLARELAQRAARRAAHAGGGI